MFFVPFPTKDTRAKTAPRMCQGIFLGYRTAPGGKWAGDYLVADLNDFAGLPLHVDVEPGHFRNVRPHVTRTVNWTPAGATFPLFARSVEHNETIEGIEQCGAHMKQERARRKREIAPKFSVDEIKAHRAFASFKG